MGGLVRVFKKEPPRQVVQEEIQAKKTEPKKLARKSLPGSRTARKTGMMSNYEAELAAETTRNPLKLRTELGVA